jgi:hypothetical protein
MNKFDSLKDSVSNGLNGLLSPTMPTAGIPSATPSSSKKKEPAVHCNFVIDKSVHRRMKLLSLKRGISLRQIVNEAMTEYLERNGE